MKMKTACTLGFGLVMAGIMVCGADDLFKMTWRGTAYSTGANGQIVAKSFSEKDFINTVAFDNSLDPKTLSFVYRPGKHDTAVVKTATGEFVSDVLQMENTFTEAGDTNGTKIVRQAFIFDEAHTSALGSAFGTETMKHDANGNLVSDKFHGTFQYSIPETGTIYSGNFNTSTRIKDTSTPAATP